MPDQSTLFTELSFKAKKVVKWVVACRTPAFQYCQKAIKVTHSYFNVVPVEKEFDLVLVHILATF